MPTGSSTPPGRHLAPPATNTPPIRRPVLAPVVLLLMFCAAIGALSLTPASGDSTTGTPTTGTQAPGTPEPGTGQRSGAVRTAHSLPTTTDPVTVLLGAADAVVGQATAASQALATAEAAQVATRVAAAAQERASRAARVQAARPSSGPITSSFGRRWGRMHEGLDFGAPAGSPIVAAASGTVISAGRDDGGFGNLTLIRLPDGTVNAYAHQSRILVSTGDQVIVGDTIGLVGSTGSSTGPHLHFEVRPGGGEGIDPRPWLAARGVDV